jgi:metal-responsive CopG/Arc/MetJ family transcriptional regulator
VGGLEYERAEFMASVIKNNIEEKDPDRNIYNLRTIYNEMVQDVANDVLIDLNESYDKALTYALKEDVHIEDIKPEYEPLTNDEIDEEMSILDLMLNSNITHERAKFMADVIKNYIEDNEPNRDIYDISIIYNTMVNEISNDPMAELDEVYEKGKSEATK